MHYLDTSALVKLVVREAESDALVSWLQSHPTVATSDLTRTELMRAVRRGDDLESVVTYDTRMADVVRRLGLPVTAPA